MCLSAKLRDIITRAFEVSQEAYAAELTEHNAVLGLSGDFAFRSEVRPKFFTGNPDSLKPSSYLLVLSLNHKYKPGPGTNEELAALNVGPADHFMSCVNYFETDEPYVFYKRFKPVLEGMGFRPARLGMRVFFMDALPFFSSESRSLTPADLRKVGGPFAELNREAVRAVVTEVQPAALFINGKTAFSALETWGGGSVAWRDRVLANTTQVGTCKVEVSQVSLFGMSVRAVRSNFLRSVHGPNSNAQCQELGELLIAREP